MYQFVTTNIINSALDSNGSLAKYIGAATYFQVQRVGKFLTDNIVSIYKRPYTAGVKEVAKVQIPTITSGLVARLTIDLRLSEQTDSEYANAYLYFKKPVTVEIIASGTAATDAAAFAAQINKLKTVYGQSYVVAEVISTDYVQITCVNFNQRVKSMVVEKEKASTNSIIQPEYDNVSGSTFSVTTAGALGFGDDDFMVRHIKVPTLDNTRYFGLDKDGRPVIGGNYTQYTLKYKVEKSMSDGIRAEGYSITTHVFYVLSSLVSAFEAEIMKTGKVIDTVGVTVTAISITSGNLDISNVIGGTPYVTTYTTTPSGVTGAIFTINTAGSTVAGTADWTKVSVSTAGVINLTTGHGLAGGDKIKLNVAIDNYTTTVEITLQA